MFFFLSVYLPPRITFPWKPSPTYTVGPYRPPIFYSNKLSGDDWVTIIKAGLKCIHAVVDIVKGIMGKEENCYDKAQQAASQVQGHYQQLSQVEQELHDMGVWENFDWSMLVPLVKCIPTILDVVSTYFEENCQVETTAAGPDSPPGDMTIASIALSQSMFSPCFVM